MPVIIGVSSRFFGLKFPFALVDVPESFRDALPMNEEGAMRAGQALSDALTARGWSAVDLAVHADIPDPATIRAFLAGNSWPRAVTRGRMERALGLAPGYLERVAKGREEVGGDASQQDAIERAINASPDLDRFEKARLIVAYADILASRETA